ncbi:hypothetical protein [Paraburkholderia fungorum]|jgi:hypothetical protein|uniref:hypothetical protein n=1 Tax=Paraburkholderia fungorum TaxID=134537 RepID=UPI0004AB94D7|nr:hypothetical protein [Paraburkholderia fungorum]KFX65597.1 hypothetical protein KBK24_0112315 [Burkholderia sp. K24]MBU7438273.1 hypothetical protein [Paraburkholderia fungorum]PZR50333.1 MAG: hypothetical protein DI523_04415 [Paraburkholderia fungorum]QLD53503.1 hypothetical protein C9419_32670 [Paraburkholderia fungorum]USU20166.1 hypothetical protein NFE55_23655 [Paraburkholderia fungorum]
MNHLASQRSAAARKPSASVSGVTRVQANWIFGAAIGLSLCILLGIAIACAPAAVRSNNERCLEALANEQHVSVEDFFQNPAKQDALALAAEQCAR